MLQDLIAGYTLTTKLHPDQIEDMLSLFRGVRQISALELPTPGEIAVEVRIHGQTERAVAEDTAERIEDMLSHHSAFERVEYHGLQGQEAPFVPAEWKGGDPIEDVVKRFESSYWVRVDYFVHALSFDDIGIRDDNTEQMLVSAFQGYGKKDLAREAIRRLRSHFALLEDIRQIAHMPISGSKPTVSEAADPEPVYETVAAE